MYNRKYDRKTMILKQETDSFSRQSQDTAIGTVEIKNGMGKMIVKGSFPQNSRIYFVANDDSNNMVMDIGKINEGAFDADNVCGSGKKIEAFDVFVVGSRKNDGEFFTDILVGYSNKRRDWRKNVRDKKEEKPACIQEKKEDEERSNPLNFMPTEEKIEEIQEERLRKEYEDNQIKHIEEIMKNANVPKEKLVLWEVKKEKAIKTTEQPKAHLGDNDGDVHDTFKKIVKNFNKQMQSLESMGVLSLSEVASIQGQNSKPCEEKEERREEEKEEEERREGEKKKGEEKTKSVFPKEVDNIFNNNPKMAPFEGNECQWVRVCPEELWLIPLKDTSVNNSSFVICSDKKYKHLLLGRQSDGCILLAVPQVFSEKDRKKALSIGFADFWCNKGQTLDEGSYGYWIRKME